MVLAQEIVVYLATVWMTALLGVSVVLLVRAQTVAAIVLVLDTLTLILIALLVVYSISTRSYFYLDSALILALLSFVGTIAAARFAGERGSPFA